MKRYPRVIEILRNAANDLMWFHPNGNGDSGNFTWIEFQFSPVREVPHPLFSTDLTLFGRFIKHLSQDLSPLILVKRSIDHRWRIFMLMKAQIKIGYTHTPPLSWPGTGTTSISVENRAACEFPISLCLWAEGLSRSNLDAHQFAGSDWATDRTQKKKKNLKKKNRARWNGLELGAGSGV